MTPTDFRKTYSDQLKTFLATPCGQHFLSVLGSMRPGYEYSVQSHLLIENRGAMRGYELALRNSLGLSMAYSVQQEAEPTYGVPNPKS